MNRHPDVLILGGGVIGLTTAYFLAEAGVAVTLLDRGELGHQSSWAGAGIISPGNPERAQAPYDLLRARSANLYPGLSERLRAETGIDNGYRACGGFVLEVEGNAPARWRQEEIPFSHLQADELHRQLPGLAAGWKEGYHLPGMAQVRNPRHIKALVAACTGRGVVLRPGCAVSALRTRDGDVLHVETDQGPLSAARYLLCAGAWTEELLRQVGCPVGIHPVRGQIALLQTGQEGVRPIVEVGRRYLVPRGDGRVLVGSTEEVVGFVPQPTTRGIGGLLAFAETVLPELAGATLERCWAGLRPGSPDGHPFLGQVPGQDNLFVAAGHYRTGIQLSPATGLMMSELLQDRPPSIPLEPFRVDRAPGAPGQTAFRS